MRSAPKTLHAVTAALTVPELYPELCDGEIISCIRWHTTGRENMTLCEKLLYLSDYIDMSRDFEDCVKLRDMFFSANPEQMDEEARLKHLDRVLLASYDINISALIRKNSVISVDTLNARNSLLCELHNA